MPRSRHAIRSLTVVCALLVAGCGGSQPKVVARAGGESGAGTAPRVGAAVGAGAEAGVLVDVAGHVRRPGVYRVAAGARVHEAIAAAGGVRPGAQLAGLNRAAPVVDGQQVVVPGPEGAGDAGSPGTAPGDGAGAASGAPVSLNSADAAALDELPGIGPVTAERIVADREANGPFAGVDDLDRVAGIGPATIEQLRAVVTA